MSDSQKDIWSQWLLNRRFGGDPERMKKMFDFLDPIRDKVLSHIHLEQNGTLLDVGCGDGLLAFGALEGYGYTAGRICGHPARWQTDHDHGHPYPSAAK